MKRHTLGHRTSARIAAALGAVALAAVGVVDAQPAAAVQAGQVLYSPDLVTYPQAKDGYPRAIRLDHDGSGGLTMLATFARAHQGGPADMPVFRSADAGSTWTQVSTITSHTPGWDIEAPTLFEVPRTSHGLDAGDILAAGTAWVVGDYTAQKIEVFKSVDGGSSWQYLSDCTATSGMPNSWGQGIWEPTFLLAPDNTLACFISDERPPNSPTNNQIIDHYTSNDGGVSWSATATVDVAFPSDNLARPGMPTFAELPDGSYLMSYEMCRDAVDPDHECEVYIKRSPDGLTWAPTDDPGTMVETSDGRQLLHTPTISWMPAGGPDGTVLLTGQRVVTGPTGNKSVMVESGEVLFANTDLGHGDWVEIEAPVTVDPTGSYAVGAPSCPGYSSVAVPRSDGTSFLYVAATWLGQNDQCEIRFAVGGAVGPTGPVGAPGGLCLDVETNTALNGNAAQLADCNGMTGQQWSVQADGTIRAFGKCLDVDAQGTANGTKVQLWECNGSGAQQWRIQADNAMVNPQSGRCLDVPAGNAVAGQDLQIYDCNGLWPQVFVPAGYPTGPIGGPAGHDFCVDVDTNTSTNGNPVQLWDCNGVPGQQWAMHTDGTIRAFGKCMDVDGQGTSNGTKVQLWDCNGSGAQQWVVQSGGALLNPQSGRCLDTPAGNAVTGQDLQIYDCNGLWTQQWSLPS